MILYQILYYMMVMFIEYRTNIYIIIKYCKKNKYIYFEYNY